MLSTLFTIKILIPTFCSFVVGLALTPYFSSLFYKYKMWKKSSRISDENTIGVLEMSENFRDIHNEKETKTPRVGGILVWLSVFVTAGLAALAAYVFDDSLLKHLNFISRSQTWIPLVAMFLGASIGLIDDFLQIFGKTKKQLTLGVPRAVRIVFVLSVAVFWAFWFFVKLSYNAIEIPFIGEFWIGFFFIPFFILVFLGIFSSSVIDGVDGLAGGVFALIFASYGFIGLIQDQLSIASFSFVVAGALLAFLWFNIPPARFYLGETGILALTFSLATLVFLTNTVIEFLVIGFPLVISSFSSFAQIISRRYLKKPLFKLAPLHHHFEALGWSREKITMRYWVFTAMCSVAGILLVILA